MSKKCKSSSKDALLGAYMPTVPDDDLFLFHGYEMLTFSTLINSMAVFTLVVNRTKNKRNVLDYK